MCQKKQKNVIGPITCCVKSPVIRIPTPHQRHHRTYQEGLFHATEANDWPMSGQLPKGGLLLGVAADIAIRQRLLQFSNLRLGEVGVVAEMQPI